MKRVRFRKNEKMRLAPGSPAVRITTPGLYLISATIMWAPPRRQPNGPHLARSRKRRRGR